MKKLIYIALAGAALFGSTGCRKYVEIDQVGKRTLHYTSDYQNILNNIDAVEQSYYYSTLASDEMSVYDDMYANAMSDQEKSVYRWAADLFGDTNDTDWDALYKSIFMFNQVADEVMDSDGGTDKQKRSIRAAAQVHRAYAYWVLVNTYAKQYDATTAATDPGVPMLLQPVFFVNLKRATVEQVYTQIKKDLTEAIADLPATSQFNTFPSQAAAFAVLARTCLQMGAYADAGRFADSALLRKNGLLDLNDHISDPFTLPARFNDPELIFSKSLNGVGVLALSQETIDLFDANDLRYELFTADGQEVFFRPFNGRTYFRYLRTFGTTGYVLQIGLNVPEMMLIKAESLARANNGGDAVDILNTLRQKRFRAADYVALSATTADEALDLVIEERRRELLGGGIRWFDQKRLNKEPHFAKTVTRQLLGETYTLAPNSNRYVFPIGSKYILLNPEIEQNPR
ncbi:RagB/SusD family nutrient uptake outer membrane protein [uncultured Chitinophaga sp.]|uniref:RagB/SusD family nutrient uptake outer membrane protein n=1 Tax=uncultured Chitinophaga sp. TaxID=339340 RepID=UPI0025D22CA8|nr:RagB/SusD family nutrient uptake outer membrane protein [uncultured Chitinophaga sp.]